MTSGQITELRKLHDGCIAQDLGRLDDEHVVTVPVYRENAAFLIACNNSIRQLLDEREALLEACRAFVNRAAELNVPMTASELKARNAIAKAESP